MPSLVRTVAPTQLPVGLDELKARLKITHNDADAALQSYLEAATDYCQEYQWAQYCTATYVERYDQFPNMFVPQRNPLISATSIVYNDVSNQAVTLTQNTDYTVDIYSKPARIVPAFNTSWPATYAHVNAVTLTYVAGYGGPADVPSEIKHAILLKAAQQYGDCDGNSIAAMDRMIHALLDKRSFRIFY